MSQSADDNYAPISYEEVNEAWLNFWGKNKLSVDENGKVYRTNIPRKIPQVKFNYHKRRKNNESKLQLHQAYRN